MRLNVRLNGIEIIEVSYWNAYANAPYIQLLSVYY